MLFKKVTASLLSLVLVVSLTPAAAFAAPETEEQQDSGMLQQEESSSKQSVDEEQGAVPSDSQSATEESISKIEEIQSVEPAAIQETGDPRYENSWRYSNGELKMAEDDETIDVMAARTGFTDPPSNTVAKGIDVSEHNGSIDWAAVARSGVNFAIIRCGYGQNQTAQDDKYFIRNVQGARKNGIDIGIYIYSYAYNNTMASGEADHTLRLLREAGLSPSDLAYPVYYDMEEQRDGRPCCQGNYLSNSQLESMANTFCNKIKNAGYTPGVYANTNWWRNFLTGSSFSKYEKWVAQYNSVCTYSGSYGIWQCSSSGKIPGISGSTDLNFAVKEYVKTQGKIAYRTHIQDVGWQGWRYDGAQSGTDHQSKRLEAIKIEKGNLTEESGSINYRTHVQDYGWMDWVSDGELSGTSGKSKRLEAIQIELTGELANKYDVYYRVHAENFGWLDWAKNGGYAGTQGFCYRLEAIEIQLVEKGGEAPGSTQTPFQHKKHIYGEWTDVSAATCADAGTQERVCTVEGCSSKETRTVPAKGHQGDWTVTKEPTLTSAGSMERVCTACSNKETKEIAPLGVFYKSHVQDFGWETSWKSNGQMSGTSGKSKRLEAMYIKLSDNATLAYPGSGITYRTHVQDYGWMNWVSDGALSGTSGKSKRLEAIQIKLTGELANKYDVYYRVHAQQFGWMGWAKNGEQAGTSGYSYRLESIEIKLVEKGGAAPGSTANAFRKR